MLMRAVVFIVAALVLAYVGAVLKVAIDGGYWWISPLALVAILWLGYAIGNEEDRHGYAVAWAKLKGQSPPKSPADVRRLVELERRARQPEPEPDLRLDAERTEADLARRHPPLPLERRAFEPYQLPLAGFAHSEPQPIGHSTPGLVLRREDLLRMSVEAQRPGFDRTDGG